MAENSKLVYVALGANVVVMAAKFITGAVSGSSSLLAEGFHSLADTGDGIMLLVGKKRSKAPADDLHPFGHGKELYFWTLVVAVSIFTIGGVASVIEGIDSVVKPEQLKKPLWNYVALGAGFLFEGGSMIFAWRQFLREKGKGRSIGEGIREAKDPTTFLVVFEDSAAVAGVVVAALAVFLSHRLKAPRLDGAGAIVVGLLMASVASFLVFEIRKLLVGEKALPELLDGARAVLERDPAVRRVGNSRSAHFGPDTVLLTVRAEFDPALSAAEVADAIDRLHHAVRQEHPDVKYLYIEPRRTDGDGREETDRTGKGEQAKNGERERH